MEITEFLEARAAARRGGFVDAIGNRHATPEAREYADAQRHWDATGRPDAEKPRIATLHAAMVSARRRLSASAGRR